jgi:hypothetical protein
MRCNRIFIREGRIQKYYNLIQRKQDIWKEQTTPSGFTTLAKKTRVT